MTFNKAVISSQKIDMYRTGALLLLIAMKIETCMIQGSTESKINCAQYNQSTEITATVNTSI